jgi:hypothetical protein
MVVPGRTANSPKWLNPTAVGDKIDEKKEKKAD